MRRSRWAQRDYPERPELRSRRACGTETGRLRRSASSREACTAAATAAVLDEEAVRRVRCLTPRRRGDDHGIRGRRHGKKPRVRRANTASTLGRTKVARIRTTRKDAATYVVTAAP